MSDPRMRRRGPKAGARVPKDAPAVAADAAGGYRPADDGQQRRHQRDDGEHVAASRDAPEEAAEVAGTETVLLAGRDYPSRSP